MAPRLKERYKEEIVPVMMQEFGYKNVMQTPRVEKVTLNVGAGEAVQNAKALDAASSDIATITGQHPVITRAKRSIANFKLREGMPIGVMVTGKLYDEATVLRVGHAYEIACEWRQRRPTI